MQAEFREPLFIGMSFQNRPSHQLAGQTIVGAKARRSWHVQRMLARPIDGTGGNFSVGYLATDISGGEEHFLKATDIGLLGIDNNISRLDQTTEALILQKFEREMLDLCTQKGMDRIVRAVDYGEKRVSINGVAEYVFFIVFEKANGDIRGLAHSFRQTGIGWIPRIVHNLAIATTQLHRNDISHNDIKPSNLLVFDAAVQKLSDLGRATCDTVAGPWDKLRAAGDKFYSAPEAWGYEYRLPMTGSRVSHSYRKLCDLYMLGSLIYFLLTEQPLNNVMVQFLRPEYRPENWTGSFADVLPYLRDAHGKAMAKMKAEINQTYGEENARNLVEIIQAVMYLTEVDPTLRGDSRNLAAGRPRHDLQRLISLADLKSKRLALKDRR